MTFESLTPKLVAGSAATSTQFPLCALQELFFQVTSAPGADRGPGSAPPCWPVRSKRARSMAYPHDFLALVHSTGPQVDTVSRGWEEPAGIHSGTPLAWQACRDAGNLAGATAPRCGISNFSPNRLQPCTNLRLSCTFPRCATTCARSALGPGSPFTRHIPRYGGKPFRVQTRPAGREAAPVRVGGQAPGRPARGRVDLLNVVRVPVPGSSPRVAIPGRVPPGRPDDPHAGLPELISTLITHHSIDNPAHAEPA